MPGLLLEHVVMHTDEAEADRLRAAPRRSFAQPFIPFSSTPPETSREEHPHPFHLTLCLTKEI